MAGVVFGPGSNWSRLCHKSVRRDVVIMIVPSPLVSPAMKNHWSAPSSSRSKPQVEDDGWGRVVSDSAFKMDFSIFRLNE